MRLRTVTMAAAILCAAPCHAGGLFSFFNPEVSVPVTAAPSNGSDIIGGMKATITLGSLGSVLTAHLSIIVMAILLYTAIRRLNPDVYARLTDLKSQRCASRLERAKMRSDRKIKRYEAKRHRRTWW
jgi:hypothetical protein